MILRVANRPADDPDATPVIHTYRGTDFSALRAVANAELGEGWVRVWMWVEGE